MSNTQCNCEIEKTFKRVANYRQFDEYYFLGWSYAYFAGKIAVTGAFKRNSGTQSANGELSIQEYKYGIDGIVPCKFSSYHPHYKENYKGEK